MIIFPLQIIQSIVQQLCQEEMLNGKGAYIIFVGRQQNVK